MIVFLGLFKTFIESRDGSSSQLNSFSNSRCDGFDCEDVSKNKGYRISPCQKKAKVVTKLSLKACHKN